mmetsp:Transcript_39267/g.94441  ORF Transcript_39267/g.94441 Transcript_39267/m.94441 type:complete len:90 (+) Transcript_39267:274-543(+)
MYCIKSICGNCGGFCARIVRNNVVCTCCRGKRHIVFLFRQSMSAHGTGISLLQPLLKALAMKKMLAWEESLLVTQSEVFTTESALLAVV